MMSRKIPQRHQKIYCNHKLEIVLQIATLIEPSVTFYMAEEYHQQYFEKKGQVSLFFQDVGDNQIDA